jgi:hypothetical protein
MRFRETLEIRHPIDAVKRANRLIGELAAGGARSAD